MKEEYSTKKSSKLREFLRIHFWSGPLRQTRKYKDKVLDLGCGWGFYFKINPAAYGIDIDENCVKYLKNLGLKVVKGNILNELPFSENSFECAVCHDVLEHFDLEDVKKIFSNVYRVLAPSGFFLIIVPNQKGYKGGLNAGHKHFITPKEIILIAKEKFRTEKNYSYPLPSSIGNCFFHNKEVVLLKKQ